MPRLRTLRILDGLADRLGDITRLLLLCYVGILPGYSKHALRRLPGRNTIRHFEMTEEQRKANFRFDYS